MYSKKLLGLEYLSGQSLLIVAGDNFIDVVHIKRGLKAGNIKDAHSGPIIGLFGLVPYKITEGYYKEPP